MLMAHHKLILFMGTHIWASSSSIVFSLFLCAAMPRALWCLVISAFWNHRPDKYANCLLFLQFCFSMISHFSSCANTYLSHGFILFSQCSVLLFCCASSPRWGSLQVCLYRFTTGAGRGGCRSTLKITLLGFTTGAGGSRCGSTL